MCTVYNVHNVCSFQRRVYTAVHRVGAPCAHNVLTQDFMGNRTKIKRWISRMKIRIHIYARSLAGETLHHPRACFLHQRARLAC